jgi:hypothetical protein
MIHNFTALLGKLADILRRHPDARLTCEQDGMLAQLSEQYTGLYQRYSRALPQDDPLVRLYVRTFELGVSSINLLRGLYQGDPADPDRPLRLQRCCTQVEELEGLMLQTDMGTAVRFAERYVAEASRRSS